MCLKRFWCGTAFQTRRSSWRGVAAIGSFAAARVPPGTRRFYFLSRAHVRASSEILDAARKVIIRKRGCLRVSEQVISSRDVFSAGRCLCLCIWGGGGGLTSSSGVLSRLLQQETGTEIVRSQGTIGGEVTIAQALSAHSRVMGAAGSVLLPRCVFQAAKDHGVTNHALTQVYLKCPCTHTPAGGRPSVSPVLSTSPRVLFIQAFLPFLPRCAFHATTRFLPLSTLTTLSVRTPPSLYCEHCAGPGTTLAASSCGPCEKRPKQKLRAAFQASVVLVAEPRRWDYPVRLDG